MEQETRKLAYYITQYAAFTDDDAVYEALDSWIEAYEIDESSLQDLLREMPKISDSINQKVYDHLYELPSSAIEDLVRIYLAIQDEDLSILEDYMDIDEYMAENRIYTPDVWEELADSDLRENGIDANALYWVSDISGNYDYQQMNAYENALSGVDTADVIQAALDELFDSWLDDQEE